MGITPSGVMPNWDDNLPWIQCQLIAYEQIREYEESQTTETIASGGRSLM